MVLLQTGDTLKTNKRAIGKSIAGRNIHDGVDFYQTPAWATEKLLEKEWFSGLSILEPCSGNGAISTVLENYGYSVQSSDLRTDELVYGTKGLSIFDITANSSDHVITNPPYCIAQEVIEKSLEIATGKVAMLLKLTFLESAKRNLFFKSTPLKKVYIFSRRLTMHAYATELPKNNGTIAYAWFVWERDYVGSPAIDWVI